MILYNELRHSSTNEWTQYSVSTNYIDRLSKKFELIKFEIEKIEKQKLRELKINRIVNFDKIK